MMMFKGFKSKGGVVEIKVANVEVSDSITESDCHIDPETVLKEDIVNDANCKHHPEDPAGAANEQKDSSFEETFDDQSPVEEVALTVPTTDDPSLPVWTIRVWVIGIVSSLVLTFINTFFGYHTEPLSVTSVAAQIAALPVGRFMANVLPHKRVSIPFTDWSFSLNPGPFNVKEHVLITIFANAGGGDAYAIYIVNAIKAFYHRTLDFVPALLLVLTTQLLGYGWAGLMRRYLVEPAHMWWPSNLVQVSLFHFPSYLVPILTSFSVLCLVFPKSITAQQIGSGQKGLGIGAFSFDWASTTAFLGSPLATPWYTLANISLGFGLYLYILIPLLYWRNVYNARTFPLFSSNLFRLDGRRYDTNRIITSDFRLDLKAYEEYGPMHMSITFAMTYALSFATISSAFTHVALFHGRDVWRRSRAALKNQDKVDVHTRLMSRYPQVPEKWFQALLLCTVLVAIFTVIVYKDQLQLPWWGVLLAAVLAAVLTLPIGILVATTNTGPGLNVISEYIMGYLLPGQPIANVTFKTYSTIANGQALNFLSDFKLGHYMKIPPRPMFIAQIVGTIISGLVNVMVAWWLLRTVKNLCDTDKLAADSVWTCPNDRVFYDASVIWGLVGPQRIFGPLGAYKALNWAFFIGFLLPFPVWLASKKFPKRKWIRLITIPVILSGGGGIPPAAAVNNTAWIAVGTFFNFYMFKFKKGWWKKYNYILSAALDAGTAFFGVFMYFCLNYGNINLQWWASDGEHCPLATCPTSPDVVYHACHPVQSS
ncbi:hypothetical protein AXG93_1736s1050 [Marchantia polymorpha subsp. ruderalis]|uniref:Oligopeptide transporter n=1 Tax=Marchantia polymorpha subsp. ruderalis TaxID=1480154 RepID=A0A176W676_MARPO|nr:hypothetical protein AXG93_1736s1050 [Marchantia polymorpha subsp. ruderalis]